MIRVKISRDNHGYIREFMVQGHAGFDKSGKDIVCAYVSGVVYTALGGLDELAGIKDYTEKNGYIICRIPADIPDNFIPVVQIILETMVIGLVQVQNQYGEYITINDKEV